MQHFNRMTFISSFIVLIVCCWVLSSITAASVISCPPNSVQQELNPKLSQLCLAIEQVLSETQPDGYASRLVDDRNLNLNVKRQDVDHVFLRFGKRMAL